MDSMRGGALEANARKGAVAEPRRVDCSPMLAAIVAAQNSSGIGRVNRHGVMRRDCQGDRSGGVSRSEKFANPVVAKCFAFRSRFVAHEFPGCSAVFGAGDTEVGGGGSSGKSERFVAAAKGNVRDIGMIWA